MPKPSLIVIDGSSILTTQYYGTLPDPIRYTKSEEMKLMMQPMIRHNSQGVFTNAISGTLNTIFRILQRQQPTYLAVVLDQTRNTFRRELYPQYKGNRKETPAPLKEQIITLQQILTDIGICVLSSSTFEADDLAGSILKRFEGDDLDTFFMTKDHDYLQLVNCYTSGYMLQSSVGQVEVFYGGITNVPKNIPYKTILYTTDVVRKMEGVDPNQVPDLKGIAGDSSDNIPGVKGVSTAAIPLLKKYGSIEGIYSAIALCNNDAKAEKELDASWKTSLGIRGGHVKKFKENKDVALLSKKLATIVTDAPIPRKLSDYAIGFNTAKALSVIDTYELGELKEEFPVLLGLQTSKATDWM